LTKKRGVARKSRHKTSSKHSVASHTKKKSHSSKHRKKPSKYKIPVGIDFLIGYVCFLALFYLGYIFFGFRTPFTMVFGELIAGKAALVINIIFLAIVVAIVIGFFKRLAWSYYLSIGWFVFGIVNAFISLLNVTESTFDILKNFMVFSFIFTVILNFIIIWYIHAEKKYFLSKRFHEKVWQNRDRIFVYTIVIFWVLVVVVGSLIASSYFGAVTEKTNLLVSELDTKYDHEAEEICSSKAGLDADLCYVMYASMLKTEKFDKVIRICKNIDSDFYRFTCLRVHAK
jgi:hypothetical protein